MGRRAACKCTNRTASHTRGLQNENLLIQMGENPVFGVIKRNPSRLCDILAERRHYLRHSKRAKIAIIIRWIKKFIWNGGFLIAAASACPANGLGECSRSRFQLKSAEAVSDVCHRFNWTNRLRPDKQIEAICEQLTAPIRTQRCVSMGSRLSYHRFGKCLGRGGANKRRTTAADVFPFRQIEILFAIGRRKQWPNTSSTRSGELGKRISFEESGKEHGVACGESFSFNYSPKSTQIN